MEELHVERKHDALKRSCSGCSGGARGGHNKELRVESERGREVVAWGPPGDGDEKQKASGKPEN